MLDPIKSLMADVTEFWNSLDVGAEVTARHIYKEIVNNLKEKNPDIHKLNAIGSFLNSQVRYSTAEKASERLVDPLFKKISNESRRAKNKRFCDVLNQEFKTEELIEVSELSLRYKNMHPNDPITRNYTSKLLIALESNGFIKKVKRGLYQKLFEIPEVQMTQATCFKKKPKAVPADLPVPEGITVVEISKLKAYIEEIKSLKLIVKAQEREIAKRDRILKSIPRTTLPDLDTTEYAGLKEKYGII
jgi:hypothetical protein